MTANFPRQAFALVLAIAVSNLLWAYTLAPALA